MKGCTHRTGTNTCHDPTLLSYSPQEAALGMDNHPSPLLFV